MTRTSATKPDSAWLFVLAVFAASRLLFLGAGALAQAFLPRAEPAGSPLEPPGFLNYWAHWDGAWYSQIATEGYGGGRPGFDRFFPVISGARAARSGSRRRAGVVGSPDLTHSDPLYALLPLRHSRTSLRHRRRSGVHAVPGFFPDRFLSERRLHRGVVF